MPIGKKTKLIIAILAIGLIIIITLITITKLKKTTKNKELKYSKKTNENFKEIELLHGEPNIFINKPKGFANWKFSQQQNNIFKNIILRDKDNNNVYSICEINLTPVQVNLITKENIIYDNGELHIKGNSIDENLKTLKVILNTLITELDKSNKLDLLLTSDNRDVRELIKEINEMNKNNINEIIKTENLNF
jgi:hypothetical protein